MGGEGGDGRGGWEGWVGAGWGRRGWVGGPRMGRPWSMDNGSVCAWQEAAERLVLLGGVGWVWLGVMGRGDGWVCTWWGGEGQRRVGQVQAEQGAGVCWAIRGEM